MKIRAALRSICVAIALVIIIIGLVVGADTAGLIEFGSRNPEIFGWLGAGWTWLLGLLVCAWLVELLSSAKMGVLFQRDFWSFSRADIRRSSNESLHDLLPVFAVIFLPMIARELFTASAYRVPNDDILIFFASSVSCLPLALTWLVFRFYAQYRKDRSRKLEYNIIRILLALWVGTYCTLLWWSIIYPIPLEGRAFGVPVVVAGLVYLQHDRVIQMLSKDPEGPVGLVVEGTRDGFPTMSWSQSIGTGASKSWVNMQLERALVVTMSALGVAIGWWMNGFPGAALGGFAGLWFGALCSRSAPRPDGRGGWIPHIQTETERRELVEPETRREECEVFVEMGAGNVMYFCVARGDRRHGLLPVVDRVPWDSFGNFEEGSHKQWFRPRGVADNLLDWDVILLQSNTGRVVRVAESVDDKAWLIELLVKLQNSFITPRSAMLKAAQNHATGPKSSSGEAPAAPVIPF